MEGSGQLSVLTKGGAYSNEGEWVAISRKGGA